jgi:hypothetical protein
LNIFVASTIVSINNQFTSLPFRAVIGTNKWVANFFDIVAKNFTMTQILQSSSFTLEFAKDFAYCVGNFSFNLECRGQKVWRTLVYSSVSQTF